MADFSHRIEIIEVDSGGRVITTPSTSVIGVVGTIEGDVVDAKFPLNTPIVITKLQDISGFTKGTIAEALNSIYNQVNCYMYYN